jgi:methylmalonyl-CoA mutase N-terminal domain/subunit
LDLIYLSSFKWSRSEYAVIGRVARKIWAKAMKTKYGANESQMLKYSNVWTFSARARN